MTVAPPPARASSPLLSLQVLRAVAACLVLLHHVGYEADTLALRAGASPFALDRLLDLGFGVDLFFVISGFIMVRTARGFGSARGATVFMVRRALRVVPLYWLLTTLTLVGLLAMPNLFNGEPGGAAWVLGSYVFVPVARGNGAINPVLGQGWTLDYEMFFYALFALAMLLPRRAALPALAAALLGLVGLGAALRPTSAAGSVWTGGLLLEFLLGLGLGLAAERGWRLGPAGAAASVLAGTALALAPIAERIDILGPPLRMGLPAALIVGGCVLGPRWAGRPAVLAAALVGDASYSLYLSHPFAVRLLGIAWRDSAPRGTPLWVYVPLACAAAVGGALLLHRWVERPMTGALQRRTVGGRPVLPEAAEGAKRERPSGALRP